MPNLNSLETPNPKEIPEANRENSYENAILQKFPHPDIQDKEQFQSWLTEIRRKLLEAETNRHIAHESGIEGQGLFAKKDFQVGETISHYFTGPYEDIRISENEEADPDYWHTVIQIGINEEGRGLYLNVPIDNPRRLLNHSCDPNAGIFKIDKDNTVTDFELKTLRPIKNGDEITIDYATTQLEEWEMPCHCGSSSCRGVVTDFARLPSEMQEKYVNLGIVPKYITDTMNKKQE